ncbi:MAG: type II secretion system F family protein [Planctomycetota bacterium]
MRYRSTYLEEGGRSVTAVLEAPDEQALHEQLHRSGRTLVRVRALDAADPGLASQARLRPSRVLLFLQALENALDAGVPLLTALAALEEQEDDAAAAAIYADVRARIAGGQTLSDALAHYPRSFPPVSCALVRVGESSGNLPAVLASMVGFLEWRASIAGTVKQAALYPAVVLTAGYGLLLFLMSFVIPKLGSVLAKMGDQLPAASRMLIRSSEFVAANLGAILLGSVAAVAGLVLLVRTDGGRALFARVFGAVPVASGIVRSLGLVQTCRNLAVMLHAGITLPAAVEHTAAAVGLPRLRESLLAVRDRLLGGNRLCDALQEHEVLPPLALSMVRVGEDSGRLPQSFERLAQVYDREVREAVKRALSLLEPVVTIVLGIAVGGVAVLVITTIYGAMKGLGR